MQQNLAQVLQDMGRDIAIPGVELAINLLQELLADLKGGRTVNIIDIEAPAAVPAKRLGRPPGRKSGSSWSGMSAEERSVEMRRRRALGKAKRGETVKIKGMHPRDPRHPGHEAWIEKLKTSQKRYWDTMSPAQQQAKTRKMLKSRAANQTARAAVDEMQVAS